MDVASEYFGGSLENGVCVVCEACELIRQPHRLFYPMELPDILSSLEELGLLSVLGVSPDSAFPTEKPSSRRCNYHAAITGALEELGRDREAEDGHDDDERSSWHTDDSFF